MAQPKRGASEMSDIGNVSKSERPQAEGTNKKSIEQWLIEVKNVDQDAETAGREQRLVCIFAVPITLKGLKGKKAAAIYAPHIVSCGPFHFHEHEDASSMGKNVKSAIIRSIRTKWGIHGERFISAIIQKIKADDQSIRGRYDRDIKFDSEVLSWMMTRDAIFILQFLRQRLLVPELRFLSQSPSQQHAGLSLNNEATSYLIKGYVQRFTVEIDSIPLADTLKDLIKLENQIPLCVIRSILQIEREMNIMELREESTTGKARQKLQVKLSSAETDDKGEKVPVDEELQYILESTCRFLSPIVKAEPTLPKNWKERANHIMEALRYYVVSDVSNQQGSRDQARAAFAFQFVLHAIKFLFQCFLYVITLPFIWRTEKGENTILKCAVELEMAGVKFSPLDGGIEGIHFDERISTLYLPKVEVDPHTESVMRNMMAFELCYSEDVIGGNAVTRYAHFMDQLIDTDKDVAVLRQSGIIQNKLGSDSKVADFWNSLSDSTWTPTYPPIDAATEKMKKYYLKRRSAVYALWNEFREQNCAKPWTFVALLVSLGLVITTILEVNCAYHPCSA